MMVDGRYCIECDTAIQPSCSPDRRLHPHGNPHLAERIRPQAPIMHGPPSPVPVVDQSGHVTTWNGYPFLIEPR